MKGILRSLFSPILNLFESGKGDYSYESSHRKILLFMGPVFSGLAIAVFVSSRDAEMGYLIPVFVFGCVGLLCLVVGILGSDRAVAKIWGSGK